MENYKPFISEVVVSLVGDENSSQKVADSLNWPKESWVLLLQSVLVGKAQEIYGSLSVEQSSNYEHVKEAILKAYELVPEAYRQKFRNYLKYDSKTHVEFARGKIDH